MQLGTVLQATFTYRPCQGRLRELVYRSTENGAPVAGSRYLYNAVGSRTEEIELHRGDASGKRYVYDTLNRLVCVQYAVENVSARHSAFDREEQFELDHRGAWHRKTVRSSGGETIDELDAVFNVRGGVTSVGRHRFFYDANGNRVRQSSGGGDGAESHYRYDYANRLTRVELVDASGALLRTIEYAYDAFGRQVQKRLTDESHVSLVDRVWHGRQLVEEWEGGNLARSFQYGATTNLPVAMTLHGAASRRYVEAQKQVPRRAVLVRSALEVDETRAAAATGSSPEEELLPVGPSGDWVMLFYVYNGCGQVIALVEADGTVVARYTYDALGNAVLVELRGEAVERDQGVALDQRVALGQTQLASVFSNPLLGNLGLYDPDTGLTYYFAGVYDPKLGQVFNPESRTGEPGYGNDYSVGVKCGDAPGYDPTIAQGDETDWEKVGKTTYHGAKASYHGTRASLEAGYAAMAAAAGNKPAAAAHGAKAAYHGAQAAYHSWQAADAAIKPQGNDGGTGKPSSAPPDAGPGGGSCGGSGGGTAAPVSTPTSEPKNPPASTPTSAPNNPPASTPTSEPKNPPANTR